MTGLIHRGLSSSIFPFPPPVLSSARWWEEKASSDSGPFFPRPIPPCMNSVVDCIAGLQIFLIGTIKPSSVSPRFHAIDIAVKFIVVIIFQFSEWNICMVFYLYHPWTHYAGFGSWWMTFGLLPNEAVPWHSWVWSDDQNTTRHSDWEC